MCFTFESVDYCLQSARHSCKKVWQKPTVGSFGDANAFLKKCVFVLEQVQHQLLQYIFVFAQCPFKEYSYSMKIMHCFEQGAM